MVDRAVGGIDARDAHAVLDGTYLEGVGGRAGKEGLAFCAPVRAPRERADKFVFRGIENTLTRPHFGTSCASRNCRPAMGSGLLHDQLDG